MSYQRNVNPFPQRVPELDSINRSEVWRARSSEYAGSVNRPMVLILVQRGWQDFRVAGKWQRVVGGQMLLVPSGVPLQLDGRPVTRIRAYDLYLRLHLRRPFLGNRCFEPLRLGLRRLPVMHCQYPAALLGQLTYLFELAGGPSAELTEGRVLLALAQIALALLEITPEDAHRPAPAYVEQAIAYMHGRLDEPLSLKELVEHVGYSRSALVQAFRRYSGMPPVEYFLQMRLEKAREYLAGSEQPVTQIAHLLGFRSSQHFATAFARNTLLSPTAYREQARQQAQT